MRGNSKAVNLLDSNTGFCISVITYMELLQGMKNKVELRKFQTALQLWKVKVLQINEIISTKAMFLVEHYALSHSIQLADALIATTTIQQNKTLHTGNLKDFKIIKNLQINPFII